MNDVALSTLLINEQRGAKASLWLSYLKRVGAHS
jgi:hypothetical protein